MIAKAWGMDIEAEQHVLGGIILWPQESIMMLYTANEKLTPQSFADLAHQAIYKAMVSLAGKKINIEVESLYHELEQTKQLAEHGGPVDLMTITDLTNRVATSANFSYFVKRVCDKEMYRAMMGALEGSMQAYTSFDGDVSAWTNHVFKRVSDATVAQKRTQNATRTLDEDYVRFFSDLDSGELQRSYTATGIDAVDELTGGLAPGVLTIVGAMPGSGKSAFIRNIAQNIAERGDGVLCFELEDTRQHAARRILARFSGLDATDLQRGNVSADERRNIVHAINRASNQPLYVNDLAGMTAEDIVTHARAFCAQHDIKVIVVDHLFEVTARGNTLGRLGEVANNTATALRNMAKDLGVSVVALTLLNRDFESRGFDKPQINDLLYQAGKAQARAVWLLKRRGYESGESHDKRLEVHVAKTTHGVPGVVANLWVDFSRMHVKSWDDGEHGLFDSDPPKTGKPKISFAEMHRGRAKQAPGEPY